MAVRQPLDRDRIVEVARVLAVDRHRRDTAEIGAALDVALLHGQPEPRRLVDGVLRVRVRDVELADDDLRVDAGLVDAAEHFDDASDRTARRGRPARDLDDHHLARLGRRPLPRRHVHVGQHATVERHDVAEAGGVDLEAADDAALAALENLDDAAFEPFSVRRSTRATTRSPCIASVRLAAAM